MWAAGWRDKRQARSLSVRGSCQVARAAGGSPGRPVACFPLVGARVRRRKEGTNRRARGCLGRDCLKWSQWSQGRAHTPRDAAAGGGRNWLIEDGTWDGAFGAWQPCGGRGRRGWQLEDQRPRSAKAVRGRWVVQRSAARCVLCRVVSCVQLCPAVFALCCVVRPLWRDNSAQHNAQYCVKRKSLSRRRGWT